MMKKLTVLMIVVCMLFTCISFVVMPDAAFAHSSTSGKSSMPALNCGSQCLTHWYFNHASGIQGGLFAVTSNIEDPNITGCKACTWEFYMYLAGSDNKWNTNTLLVGYEEDTGYGGLCGGANGNLYWFAMYYYNLRYEDGQCFLLTNTQPQDMFIGPYAHDGGGMQAVLENSGGTLASYDFPYSEGTPSSFQNIDAYESYLNPNAGNDENAQQFGYYHYYKTGQWWYQTGDPSGTYVANPPQWYWNSKPSQGNGGIATHCIKASGTSC